MSQQHFWRLAGIAILGSQFLEEVGHPHGIETGIVEGLHADPIRFVFVVAGVVDGRLHGEAQRGLQRGDTGGRVDHCQRDGAHQTGQGHRRAACLRFHIAGDVALGHVGDFVGQYRGELALAVGVEKQACVHLDPPTKEGGRVDAGIVNQEEGKRETHPIGVGEQALPQIVDILAQHGIIDDRQTGTGKAHEGVAIAYLLLDGQGRYPGGTYVGKLIVRLGMKRGAHQGSQQGK